MTEQTQERETILRQAIMQIKPEYFSWPLDEQEKYRVALPPDEWSHIKEFVVRSLFHVEVATADDLDALLKGFNEEQRNQLNSTLLPLCGIGEDYFWLNECLGDKTLLDFSTLYDYDIWDHQFQEDVRNKELSSYAPRPYRGSLYGAWARLFIEGRFYYATLSMVAGYLHGVIEEAGYKQMEKLIPHCYVDGDRHGQRTQTGTILSQRIDAGGREDQLEELRRGFWNYLKDRYEKLQQEFDASSGKTIWIIDRSTAAENHVEIVFSDKTALQQVRLRHFMHDCNLLFENDAPLDEAVTREKAAVEQFLCVLHGGLAGA
jgi:hypothetical protein